MRFYKDRKYAGIVYNKLAIHVGIDSARASGIKEIFSRTGRPYSHCDACEWIDLGANRRAAAEKFKELTAGMPIRATCKVVESPRLDIRFLMEHGYDIITI